MPNAAGRGRSQPRDLDSQQPAQPGSAGVSRENRRDASTDEMTAHETPSIGRARIPLFVVLLSVLLLVALVPLIVFGWVTHGQMRDTLVASQQERQLHQAAAVAQRVQAFLDQQGREAVKLAESVARLDNQQVPETRALLSSFLDDTVVLAEYRPIGRAPVTVAAMELVVPKIVNDALDADARTIDENGVHPIPAAARPALTRGPFAVGPEKVLAVTLTSPVQRDGVLLGVFQQVAVMQSVWRDALTAVPAPTRLMLLGSQAEVVAQSGTSLVETPATMQRRDLVQRWAKPNGTARVATANATSSASSYELKRGGDSGVRCLGALASTGQGWAVFTEVDEALALAPADQLFRQVMVGGSIAAALAVLAAILLGSVISRPVRRLAAISKRLAEGDFSVRAESSHVAELEALGSHFNGMARKLGDLVERFRAAARDINDMFVGTIRSLAEAIDEKDPYTKGHSVRVARYSVIIGRYLGLSPEDMRWLHVSSLLHDVGKIGIDDAILKKPAALTSDEFEVMKTHPERGERILGRIPQMRNIVPGMKFHHERWRGGGYPMGLKGDEIPLQARIIAVADTFDAMTTDRPYQRSFTVADAISRISDMKGLSLAPEVVEAFSRAYEAGDLDEVLATRPGARIASLDPAREEEGELISPR